MNRLVTFLILSVAALASFVLVRSTNAQYTLTTLVNFNGGNGGPDNGADPNGGLTADMAGNLFGTAQAGGAFNGGTVFKLAATTHTFSILASLSPAGGGPVASVLIDTNGNLYGTTVFQGANNDGSVFKVASGANTVTTLVSFNQANGYEPSCALIADASGNLYGTTSLYGGGQLPFGNGTVFRVAAGTNTLTTLATFRGTNGARPLAGLIADASGNLYGTTSAGGANGLGTVFEVAAVTHTLTTLATFDGANGANPFGRLLADTSGNFYGTTSAGGSNGLGTVFELTAGTHTLTTLASFNGTNGSGPAAGLLADASGNLFGTTQYGGNLMLDNGNGAGTVFELTANTHELVSLFEFNGANGRNPLCDLISDASGNLYGTTHRGGSVGFGTVFELSPVPEPSTLVLSACGLAILAATAVRRLNRRRRAE